MRRRIAVRCRDAAAWPAWCFRRVTSSSRTLPDVIIGGAQKAGTTALFDALIGHSEVGRPWTKEVHYFDAERPRPLGWYRAHFPPRYRRVKTLEATPYYLFDASCAERIANLLPSVRLVFVLRDPTDRAISHWRHERKWGYEKREFLQAINGELGRLNRGRLYAERSFEHRHYSYIERGFYEQQLQRYYDRFDEDQILVLDYAELTSRPQESIARLCEHIGVETREELSLPKSNVGLEFSIERARETIQKLREYYAPVYMYAHRTFGFRWL